MNSMTGFGQASGATEHHRIGVALYAVNHRFLDLALRVGDEYRICEPALRELLTRRLHRGRIEVRLDIESLVEREARVELHGEAARAIHAACSGLIAEGLLQADLSVGDLLRVPGILRVTLLPEQWGTADQELLLEVCNEALDQLLAGRSWEGMKLARILDQKSAALEEVTAKLQRRRQAVLEELGAVMRRRLSELLAGTPIPEERLVQEVAMIVERGDVAEELDRLGSHLQHFRELLTQPEAVGKRLDFLAQELLREINTLGAKSRDTEMTRGVLEAKLLCEQLREQVQNVE